MADSVGCSRYDWQAFVDFPERVLSRVLGLCDAQSSTNQDDQSFARHCTRTALVNETKQFELRVRRPLTNPRFAYNFGHSLPLTKAASLS